MRVTAIIAAAGRGQRIAQGNKLLIPIGGRPILAWTLDAFQNHSAVEEIIVVSNRQDMAAIQELIAKFHFSKVGQVLPGGEERQDSVYYGLSYLEGAEFVAVHDGARPLITCELLDRLFNVCGDEVECDEVASVGQTIERELEVEGIKATPLYPAGYKGGPPFGGAILALPAYETVKKVDKENRIVATLKREELWMAHTPQVFPYEVLLKAHRKAKEEEFYATDDSALVEKLGLRVKVVPSSAENIKITTAEDIEIAEVLLRHRLKSLA